MSSFTTDGQYFNNSNTSSATDFTALIIDECKISDVKTQFIKIQQKTI